MIAIPAVFVVLQPNLGTTLIIVMDGCSLLFLAGLSWWWIAPDPGRRSPPPCRWPGALCCTTTRRRGWRPSSIPKPTRWARAGTSPRPRSPSAPAACAGKGFLGGTQSRLNFLPEKQTDFIFTNFAEEFGFAGSVALLILFAVVIFYGVQTAMSARSQFGRLLAMGIILDSNTQLSQVM